MLPRRFRAPALVAWHCPAIMFFCEHANSDGYFVLLILKQYRAYCFPNRATPRCVWSVRYYMTSCVGLVFRIAWQKQAYFITFVTVSKKHWTVQIAWKRFVNVLGPVLLCPLLNEKRDVFKMSKILYSVKCLRSLICIFDYVYLLILISLFSLFLIVVFTLFELKANSACSPPK